jgi:hypothetical protein
VLHVVFLRKARKLHDDHNTKQYTESTSGSGCPSAIIRKDLYNLNIYLTAI